ncbi:MAG: hypothetical protein C0418_03515 [Coriobacteriaceae bacterium]|nr:hypothetical protein [Coriobacteriaceae bacterium]
MNVLAKPLVLVLLAAALCVAGGCSKSPAPAKVGETVKAGGWELLVEEAVTLKDFQGKAAASGKVWLVSRAVAKNTAATTQTLDPAWFGAGKDYDTWQGTTTLKGLTGTSEVPPGGSANALSAFEVPEGVTEIALLLETPGGAAQVLLN